MLLSECFEKNKNTRLDKSNVPKLDRVASLIIEYSWPSWLYHQIINLHMRAKFQLNQKPLGQV